MAHDREHLRAYTPVNKIFCGCETVSDQLLKHALSRALRAPQHFIYKLEEQDERTLGAQGKQWGAQTICRLMDVLAFEHDRLQSRTDSSFAQSGAHVEGHPGSSPASRASLLEFGDVFHRTRSYTAGIVA